MQKAYKYFLFAALLIIIDQVIKLWMYYVVVNQHFGEIDVIPNFFKLHYVSNNGMAFGIELAGAYGKLLLSVFRLIASFGIAYYLYYLTKQNENNWLLWAVAAILAGALGNVIDCVFYGKFIVGNLPPTDTFTQNGLFYPWFHGQVIDMFYFNFLDGFWPDWVPYFGGTYHSTPIFNFADACIFCGVLTLVLFQNNILDFDKKKNELKNTENQTDVNSYHISETHHEEKIEVENNDGSSLSVSSETSEIEIEINNDNLNNKPEENV